MSGKNTALFLIFTLTLMSTLAVIDSANGLIDNTWTSKAPMNQARAGLGVASVNGKIYALGGSTTTAQGSEIVGTNEEYDPQTDIWTYKASMPTPRMAFAVAVFQNKIYCFGGTTDYLYGYSNVNEVYDPATDTWQTMMPSPTARRGLQADVVNDKIYLIGGLPHGTVNEVYAPATNSWSTKVSMPINAGFASAVVDNKIYSVGSYGRSVYHEDIGGNLTEMASVTQIYNPENNSWNKGAPPPSIINGAGGGSALALATSGQMAPKRVYILSQSSTIYNYSLQIYNPEDNTWSYGADLSAVCDYASGGVINDKLYVIGGVNRDTSTEDWYYGITIPSAANEEYTPLGYGTIIPQGSSTPTSETAEPSNLIIPVATVLTVAAIVIGVTAIVYFKKHRHNR